MNHKSAVDDILLVVRILWRFKFLIVGVTAVCSAFALYSALTAIPVFRAETTVAKALDPGAGVAASLANQLGGIASLVGVNLGGASGGGVQANELLRSRRLAEEFVVRNELIPVLFKDPQMPPTLWMAVRKLQGGVVTVREDKRAGVTVVSVNWTDANVAAKWANDYVALANEIMRARAIAESKASIAYLNDQIRQTSVVELQRVMYSLIEQETNKLMLANVKSEYALEAIDPAVAPEIRVSPRRALMVMVGTFVGGVIGVILALTLGLLQPMWKKSKQDARSVSRTHDL